MNDRSAELLSHVQSTAELYASQAQQAAVNVNVLQAKDLASLALAEEKAARQAKRASNTDKALSLIGQKLDTIQPGEGNLDTLVRVVTALDPDKQEQAGTQVQVAVVFRQEYRES